MSPDDFNRFLERLSPDAEEAGRRYLHLLNKRLVGFFNLKGICDPAAAAEETIDRAAVRIAGGAEVPDVERYCLGIARNVVKERWRLERREGSAFRRFFDALADDSTVEVERIERILKPCFEGLEEDDRELLVAYCGAVEGLSRAEHRRRLAEKKKTTVLALRIRVSRLRGRLSDCVEGAAGGS
jgi:DNA-directed RNA polymerase specialized sigma24 family protein